MSTKQIDGLPTLYPLDEVADLLGKSRRMLREMANRGDFEHIRISAKNRLMTQEQVTKLIAHLTKKAAADDGEDQDRDRARQRARRTAAPRPRRATAA